MKFNCIICKGQGYDLIAKKTRDSKNQVVKCASCAHLQLYPLPNVTEDRKFYNQDLQTKLLHKKISIQNLRNRSEADTKRRVEIVSKNFKKGQELLDVGTGYAFFIDDLKKAGFNPIGLEVGRDRRQLAKKITDVPIWKFRISGQNNTGKSFDIISLFHVLEHIQDPIKLCFDLKSYLKKGGTLIIEVPNTNHYLLNISQPYRNFYWQRAHVSYFKERNLREILKKAGYRKVDIKGVQRYTFINAINWLFFKKPQIKNPSHSTKMFSILDKFYRKFITKNLICDTLWVEAKV